MQTYEDIRLAPYTTLRVGGMARRFTVTDSSEELASAVTQADSQGTPVFVLGGGSNVLVSDEGFDGSVIHPAQDAIELLGKRGPDERHRVLVRCDAGAAWDDFVRFATERELSGVAALSGIPGCIGSACMQNIGAYGQEMGSSLVSALLLDRLTGSVREASARSLQMGYRTSILRENLEWERERGGEHFPTPRWVVLSATFGLADDPETTVEHPQLARALGVEVGETQHAAVVRDEVLAVRGSKAMLADGDAGAGKGVDHDRWSSGSFFTNPLLTYEDAQRLPAQAPRFPAHGGIKTSAAWLIEHAGFSRGFGVHGPGSRATLSSRHTLAITNRGNATSADLIELARAVRRGVHDRFGITLEPETVLVGVSL
ncbi:MAG: UDP-N-acetylmuramate dehydrogenase [Coriobacteriales bacterium]